LSANYFIKLEKTMQDGGQSGKFLPILENKKSQAQGVPWGGGIPRLV
jgi:hypothetical protein